MSRICPDTHKPAKLARTTSSCVPKNNRCDILAPRAAARNETKPYGPWTGEKRDERQRPKITTPQKCCRSRPNRDNFRPYERDPGKRKRSKNVTPGTGDGDIESVGLSDEPHLPVVVAANEGSDDQITLLALVVVDWHFGPRHDNERAVRRMVCVIGTVRRVSILNGWNEGGTFGGDNLSSEALATSPF